MESSQWRRTVETPAPPPSHADRHPEDDGPRLSSLSPCKGVSTFGEVTILDLHRWRLADSLTREQGVGAETYIAGYGLPELFTSHQL